MGGTRCWGFFYIFGIIEIRQLYLDMVKSFRQSQRNSKKEREKHLMILYTVQWNIQINLVKMNTNCKKENFLL